MSEDKTPEHEIHCTLENLTKDAKDNPNGPITKQYALGVVYLLKQVDEKTSRTAEEVRKIAQYTLAVTVASLIATLVQILFAVHPMHR